MTRLAIHGGEPIAATPVRAIWPRVTDAHVRALATQATEALSIYDRAGIVGRFEEAFAEIAHVQYTLATSSGTAALHSAFYGAQLGPGDEVICCDYGFFVTATPLVHLGATPVFVDSYADGTISVEQAEAAITSRTRAIVVTHMWGQPGRLEELRDLCDRHGLRLIEDCSHAHGATYRQRPVGSFGDAAAWSLQANKTIWAGEGGVVGTSDRGLFERAVLLGHFNRRALQEIPQESPLYGLAFTGTGLKYRAHPLGLALATPQLADLDQLIKTRQGHAAEITAALRTIPGVEIVGGSTDEVVHGYYALPALVDPRRCGFDRTTMLTALEAENIFTADIPRQMRTMSGFDVFKGGRLVYDGVTVDGPSKLDHSERLTDHMIKFFVPGYDEDAADLELVIRAIEKVGAGLARGQ